MRRTVRLLTTVSTAAVLVAGGLAGCSGGSGSDAGTSASGGGATASGAPASPSAGPATAPAGTAFVETRTSGLKFALPQDWQVFDAKKITEGGDKALVKELAQTYNVTESQLTQIFGQMDLMVVGPTEKRFAPNVNVVANALTALPAASDLAAELGKVGAKTGTPRDATTPLGPAIVVPYSLTSGSNEVKGRSIVFKGPKGFVTVTVSHVDDARADQLASMILSTVGPS